MKTGDKIKAILFVFAPIVIALIFFIVGLVLTYGTKVEGGPILLIISGIMEFIAGFVIYKFYDHARRYRCPECGTKRTLKREYLSTTENKRLDSSSRDSHGYEVHRYVTKYTHHYMDYYICPNCGEVLQEKKDLSGGEYVEYSDGRVFDHRKPIEEK